MTLSGGQKARLALARALYAERDVYLFDDVFSSLDTHVAQHVFYYAIKGVLATKTIIIVSNNIEVNMNTLMLVFIH